MPATDQKVLAALKGCDAQHPMSFQVLAKKSGVPQGELKLLLAHMQQSLPATVNSCIITKGGGTSTWFWPTGVVGAPLSFHQVNNRNWQRVLDLKSLPSSDGCGKVQPNTAISTEKVLQTAVHEKETAMRGSLPSNLNRTLFSLIADTPGIKQPVLVRAALAAHPEESQTHILKTLSNMQHVTKKIRAMGSREDRSFYVMAHAALAAPVEKSSDTDQPGNELHATKPETVNDPEAKYPALGSDGITIIIDDKNNLCISLADQDMELNPKQTARLHAFMGRVHLDGMPA